METKFQTSFIPKKPMPGPSVGGLVPAAPRHRRGGSIFMDIAVILFLVSLLSVGGALLWKQYLLGAQEGYKQELAKREKQFDIDTIEKLKARSTKITLANQLLAGHLAVSQIFSVISRLTVESVGFMSMDLTAPASSGGDIQISLSGYGSNLSAVAFQSDVLSQLEQYDLRRIVKNPIISNPALNGNGAVSFGLTASVDSGSLSYEKEITGSQGASTASSTP